MKKLLVCALMGLGVAAAPASAFAQAVGILTGHVYDQSGTPIRGVKVTVNSPSQIGGPKVTFTDDEGLFRFPGLTPSADFTLTPQAERLRPTVQKNIRIVAGQPTDVDVLMEGDTGEQTVRVVEEAPMGDTSSAAIGETFDQH